MGRQRGSVTSPYTMVSMNPERNRGTSINLLAFVGMAAVLAIAQFSHDHIVGSDGFFHIEQAARITTNSMTWMPLSVFADGWVDHQLVFHALLAPLAWLLPKVIAAKLAAVLLGAAGLTMLWSALRRQGAPLPFLIALLPVALSWQFLVRLEMPRAQGLSLALLLACVIALLEGRARLLFVLCWIYAWTYQVALLVLPIALLHSLVSRLPIGVEPPRRAWAGPFAAAAGLIAGFVVHPHSPGTLRFLWQHVVLKVLNRSELPVGGEWEAGGITTLLETGLGGIACLITASVLLMRLARSPEIPASRSTVFAVLLAASATVGALLSTKFIEYSIPFSAFALGLALRDLRRRRDGVTTRWRVLCSAALAACILWSGIEARDAIQRTEPETQRLAPAMEWASEHIPAGDRIYHFSWNDWPELVFHGPAWEYIVGLDPHFLALADPDLWTLYDKIGRGWGKNPSKPIAERFRARWAILVLPYPGEPRELLDADPGLILRFEDPSAVVYEVVTVPLGPDVSPEL